jgi:hypothetical protein
LCIVAKGPLTPQEAYYALVQAREIGEISERPEETANTVSRR